MLHTTIFQPSQGSHGRPAGTLSAQRVAPRYWSRQLNILPGDAPRGGAEGPPAEAGPLSLAPPTCASCCCIAKFRFTCSLRRSRADSMGASPLPPLPSLFFSPTLTCEPFTAVRRPIEAAPTCRLAAPPTSAPGAIFAETGFQRERTRAGSGPLPRTRVYFDIQHETCKNKAQPGARAAQSTQERARTSLQSHVLKLATPRERLGRRFAAGGQVGQGSAKSLW